MVKVKLIAEKKWMTKQPHIESRLRFDCDERDC